MCRIADCLPQGASYALAWAAESEAGKVQVVNLEVPAGMQEPLHFGCKCQYGLSIQYLISSYKLGMMFYSFANMTVQEGWDPTTLWCGRLFRLLMMYSL